MFLRFPSLRTLAVILIASAALIACTDRQVEPWALPAADSRQAAETELAADGTPSLAPSETEVPERLVPTPLPSSTAPASGAAIRAAQSTPAAPRADEPAQPVAEPEGVDSQTPSAAGVAKLRPLEPGSLRSRLGLGVPRGVTDVAFDVALAQQLGIGWYLDWYIDPDPVTYDGLEYAQLYAMRGTNLPLQRDSIAQALAANPGALWLAGNEPDVIWQDNKTPEEYARLYHEFYTFVKTLDPSAEVAIAGVSQVTPLRLQYLEQVLTSYEQLFGQPMPVDVWNIHAFVLREERDSWGVSIPPGFDVDQGMLWEIEDHNDLNLFRQQIVDFRRWMARNGQRDKPLIVTEFGILMPESYGFPPETVHRFMVDAFDYLLHARDPDLGLSPDDGRLVQRFTWYSLADSLYPTGNLIDLETGELTPLGRAFADYAAGLD